MRARREERWETLYCAFIACLRVNVYAAWHNPRVLRTRAFFYSLAALLAAGLIDGSAPAQSREMLTLQTGHSLVVQVHNLRRVAVGNADCVGVVAVGTSQLVVNGKSPCRTSVFTWDDDGGRNSYEVLVTNQDLDKVSQMLRAADLRAGRSGAQLR